MARLVVSLGTQPGSVYNTLLNICRGSYDYGEKPSPPISVDEVVLIHTKSKHVLNALKLAKLLIACSGHILSDELRLPEACRVQRIVAVPVDYVDIDSRESFRAFYDAVRRNVSRGDVVDVSGGRVSMGVAAALVARDVEAMVVATIVPPERLREIESAKQAILSTYDVDKIVADLEQGRLGCADVRERYPGLAETLNKLVTLEAKTYVLYP